MADNPSFSIVLSTYGRGRHIVPTIQSVLRQTCDDFELIVVGDGCADDTEAVVRSFADRRIAWANLSQNTGSQSFPNNEGIRLARGRWIAYIGHDDIWASSHLLDIARTIAAGQGLDIVASGCAIHGPPGSDVCHVTGLFDTPDAARQHFFPPASIAHLRDVTARIGEWRDPRVIKPPVDVDVLMRAVQAGLRFASTGRITTHKFASAYRYLSYLRVSSDEQQQMLRALEEGPDIDTQAIIDTAKKLGQFMTLQYVDYSSYPAGYLFEHNRQKRGISRPAKQLLRGRVIMEQTDEYRALDWYEVEVSAKRFRWSGPNPRPRILIPYTGDRARLAIEVRGGHPHSDLREISLFVEEQKVSYAVESGGGGESRLVADIALNPADETVLTLETPMFCPSELGINEDQRRLGIAVGNVVIEPI